MRVVIRVLGNPNILGFTRFLNRDYAVVDLYYRVLEDSVYIDAILNHELIHVLACKILNKLDCNQSGNIKDFKVVLQIAKKLLSELPEKQDFILYNLYSGLDNYVNKCGLGGECLGEEILSHVYSILYILIYKYGNKNYERDYQIVWWVLKNNGFPVPTKGLIYCPYVKIETENPVLKRYLDMVYKPNLHI